MKKVDEKIINLTPHKVIVAGKEIESSGIVSVRIQESNAVVGDIAGIPIVRQVRRSVEGQGLPDFEYGTYYIVSRPIFDALPDRKDLLAIGETIRDSEGRVVGAKNLVGRREVKAKDVQELSQKLIVEKCLDDVWEILIDYADVEFNYPSTAILLNTKDLKELSLQLKELGF